MKRLFLRLKEKKGETLVETLAALLVAVLSMAMLASALVSASDINAKAREHAEGIGTEISHAEYSDNSTSDGALSVAIAGSTYTADDGLAFSGGSSVSSYKINSTPLRQAIAQGTQVLEANKDAWKSMTVKQVLQAYIAEVGAENVYKLSEAELTALRDSAPIYRSGGYAGYNYYVFPSCVYVNGEQLNFQIINAATPSAGAPFANDGNLRPIGYLYNGKFYGCFNEAGVYIMGGQYMGSFGSFTLPELEKLRLGTDGYTLDYWFQNTDRPEAVGKKYGNGINSIILVPGGVY